MSRRVKRPLAKKSVRDDKRAGKHVARSGQVLWGTWVRWHVRFDAAVADERTVRPVGHDRVRDEIRHLLERLSPASYRG